MAWSVDRLGRSLQDLVGFLSELHALKIDLYLHQQGIDTTTPAGKALFQMMGVFAEFERTNASDEPMWRTLRDVRFCAASGGRADVRQTSRERRFCRLCEKSEVQFGFRTSVSISSDLKTNSASNCRREETTKKTIPRFFCRCDFSHSLARSGPSPDSEQFRFVPRPSPLDLR
jgi:Resolvase, N terminal domain